MYQDKETYACAPVARLSRLAASFPRAVCAGSAKVAPSLPGQEATRGRKCRVASPGGGLYAGRKSVPKSIRWYCRWVVRPAAAPTRLTWVETRRHGKALLFGAEKPRPPLRSTPLRRNGAGKPFAWVPLRLWCPVAFRPS